MTVGLAVNGAGAELGAAELSLAAVAASVVSGALLAVSVGVSSALADELELAVTGGSSASPVWLSQMMMTAATTTKAAAIAPTISHRRLCDAGGVGLAGDKGSAGDELLVVGSSVTAVSSSSASMFSASNNSVVAVGSSAAGVVAR